MAATKFPLRIVSILAVSAYLPYVMSFKCYQCNSFEDKNCDVIVPTTNNTGNPFLKECDTSLAQNKSIFCRKLTQTIRASQSDQTRVIRKCSYEKSDKDCYHFEDEDHSETVCQCFTEACNGGNRFISPGSPWKASLPVVIATLASFLLASRL